MKKLSTVSNDIQITLLMPQPLESFSLSNRHTSTKPIAVWLLIGVVMIMIQVLLGGITRLTESGLSITEWNPITGTLPPLNNQEWQAEFDKYKNTDQFRFIHADFTLSDFKYIFFWEWLHRFWARLLGIVFLAGFFYFLVKRKLKKDMIIPMIILFLLGALQGLVGWIMVKSGLLPEKMFVGHIELATHFIAALILLCYTLWFALNLLISKKHFVINAGLKKLATFIVIVLFIQLIYGAFMSGLKAATVASTWPDINGVMVPPQINNLSPWWNNLIENKFAIQFIHRMLAYLLTILVLIWSWQAFKIKRNTMFDKIKWLPIILILIQLLLGIITVIRSPYAQELVWFGLAHQFTAMLFLMAITFMLFIIRSQIKIKSI